MSDNIDIEKENIPADDEVKKHRHRHHSSHHGSHHSDKMSRRYEDSQQKVVKDTFRKVRREKVYKPIFRALLGVIILVILILFVWSVINPPQEIAETKTNPETVSDNVALKVEVAELKAEIEALDERIQGYEQKIAELEGKLAAMENNSVSAEEVAE